MSQVMLDTWAAFAWSHNPNPSLDYLAARNYQITLTNVKHTGVWEPVNVRNASLRKLDYPDAGQIPFEELEQCEFLGFPLTFYG